jgi:hypothetical protein
LERITRGTRLRPGRANQYTKHQENQSLFRAHNKDFF